MLISIVIPAFNAENFLPTAIDSALEAVDHLSGNWEIILVDNNSRDGTLRIMHEYRDRLPGLITVTRAVRQGPPAARNEGLRLAKGEWIQFLDADDRLFPDKIRSQLALATARTEWIISGYRHLYPDGQTDDTLPHSDPWKGLVFQWRIGQTSSNLYRRSTLRRVGDWNVNFPNIDDPELHFRLLADGAHYVIDPEVRSYYVHHGGQRMTGGKKPEPLRMLVNLLDKVNQSLQSCRSAYWVQNAPYFRGALLRRIRTLATYDLDGATAAYHLHFEGRQSIGRLELVPRYTKLYPYLGFRNLEMLRLSLTRILPRGMKDKLKS